MISIILGVLVYLRVKIWEKDVTVVMVVSDEGDIQKHRTGEVRQATGSRRLRKLRPRARSIVSNKEDEFIDYIFPLDLRNDYFC